MKWTLGWPQVFLNSFVIEAENKCQRKNTFVISCCIAFTHNSLYVFYLDIFFSSNQNIHKSSWGLCFWTSDPLIDRSFMNVVIWRKRISNVFFFTLSIAVIQIQDCIPYSVSKGTDWLTDFFSNTFMAL